MADIRKKIYQVQGMSCAGCEAVIEEALLKQEGISDAKAIFSKNQLIVQYDARKINYGKMKSVIKKAGYQLGVEENSEREPKNTKQLFSAIQFIGIVFLLLAVYFIVDQTIGFDFIPQITNGMGYGMLFVIGLFTSLHCVAMCGGISMTQCMNAGKKTVPEKENFRPAFFYNMGRIFSYTIIGGIVGAIGSLINFSGWARGLIAVLSGIFMILMGISMSGIFPWINRITPRIPRKFRESAVLKGKGKGPFVVGLLNGLMPCGPLQAMQIYALGTGSFLEGALSMLFFSLGTLPLMLGLGVIITMLGSRFTKKMIKVSAILVVILGMVMLGRGLVLSGAGGTVLSDTKQAEAEIAKAEVSENETESVQNITAQITNGGYPDITVQKGIPVVWNLQAEAGDINGCNRTLVIPEYGIQIDLQEGDNIIEFMPEKSGRLTYSCWMGMVTGEIEIVDNVEGVK